MGDDMLNELRELAELVEGDAACDVCAWAVGVIEKLQKENEMLKMKLERVVRQSCTSCGCNT